MPHSVVMSPEEREFWRQLEEHIDHPLYRRVEMIEQITAPSYGTYQICVSATGTDHAQQTCNSAGNS